MLMKWEAMVEVKKKYFSWEVWGGWLGVEICIVNSDRELSEKNFLEDFDQNRSELYSLFLNIFYLMWLGRVNRKKISELQNSKRKKYTYPFIRSSNRSKEQ